MSQSSFGQVSSPDNSNSNAPAPPSPTTSGMAAAQQGQEAMAGTPASALQAQQLLVGTGGLAPILGRLLNNQVADETPLNIPPPGVPMPSMENIQLTDIRTPHPNDVLCGRGGGTNNHAGNEKFRDLVNQQKVRYLHSSKRDKPYVSRGIVRAVRFQNPPGRFLQKNEQTGLFHDIGDQKAREKTSQALREGAPDIRREINTNQYGAAASHSHLPFPPPPINATAAAAAMGAGANAPPPMAAALLNASRQAMAATAAQRQFDPLEMERHVRNARLAEAAMLDKNALAAVAAAAAENSTADGATMPPSMSRVVSGMQDTNEQQAAAGLAAASGNSSVAAQILAAAGVPFPGASSVPQQLRQANLLAEARSSILQSLPNDAARAAVRAGLTGAPNPFAGLGQAASANSPSLMQSFPSANLAAAARARGLNPFLGPGGNAFPPQSSVGPAAASNNAAPRLNTPSANMLGQRAGAEKLNPVVMTNPRPSVMMDGAGRFGENVQDKAAPPPLTEDMALRLVFAETVSQKTTNGTITQDIMNAEKNSSLYVEAGLLGIDPNDMAKYLEQGHSEEEIVEQHYKLQAEKAAQEKDKKKDEEGDDKKKGDKKEEDQVEEDGKGKKDDQEEEKESGEDKKGSDKDEDGDENDKDDKDADSSKKRPASSSDDSSMPSLKKAKLQVWMPDPSKTLTQTEKRIHDALICIGAIN